MTTHYEQELEQIRRMVFRLADAAMDAIRGSVDSLREGNMDLARQVIAGDAVLDGLEIEIDDLCVRFLVTRQPAAVDLRMVLAMLKINTDLERIGDLAGNIAKETVRQEGARPFKPLVDISRMSVIAIGMLKEVFDAMSTMDGAGARAVIARDREIDDLNMQIYRELFSYMAEDPRLISRALGYIMVAKHLERIGDHITNVAERVVFFIEGIDIRHPGNYSKAGE